MTKLLSLTLGALIALSAHAQTFTESGFVIESHFVGGVQRPICFEFLHEDRISDVLVGEWITGKVKWVQNGTVVATVLDVNVSNVAERGLLGMVKSPDFDETGHLYVYYSHADVDGGTWTDNRVERYTWNGAQLVNPTLILSFPLDPSQILADRHNSGPMVFGPDGKLYGMCGDMHRGRFSNPRIEQNTSTTAVAGTGGIFRLNPDGGIPQDNPWVTHPHPSIQRLYAYGLRNTFGIQFDPLTGHLWMTDNGPSVYDEVNIVRKGYNGGWLKIMGPDSRDASYGENNLRVFNASDLTYLPGSYYEDPKFSFLLPIGITTICFVRSARFETNLRDHALIGQSNGNGRQYKLLMNEARDGFVLTGALADTVADTNAEGDTIAFLNSGSAPTDCKIGPDGNIYTTALWIERIWRIRPQNPPTVLNGRIKLSNWTPYPLGVPLTLKLMNGNTTVETIDTTLDAYGKFSVRVQTPGSYSVVAKAGTWLSKRQNSVSLSNGGWTYLRFNMDVNGDVNGDNIIDDSDLAQLLTDFGTEESASDLNGDGIVDDSDLALLLENFGLSGE